ncbi:MAG: hypothetical protein KF805_14225 [Phycisphaeraceae bacterium]|nr:hypothetical protein [Phycisphaeraceae bacterium]
MKSALDTALIAAVAASAAAFVWSGQRLWLARSNLDAARQQDAASARLIAEVRHLRMLPAIIEETPIKEDRILGLVSDCLSQSGINPSVIRDVSSESQAGGTSNYRRQNIRVQLDSIAVPDVGRFLATWNSLHPNWIPTTVNLSPATRIDAGSRSSDSPIAWTATVVFTSTYLSSQAGAAPTPEPLSQPTQPSPRRATLMPEKPSR